MSNINTTHWKSKRWQLISNLWRCLQVRFWSVRFQMFFFFQGLWRAIYVGRAHRVDLSLRLWFTSTWSTHPKRREEKRREEKRREEKRREEKRREEKRREEKENRNHSVALRVKERRGRDLPFPNIILCSSFCCFCLSWSSFMRSSWIFLCSSTIRSWSSAWNKHMSKSDIFNQPRQTGTL